MPIYEYRCDNGHLFEVMQKMSDGPVTECETCGASVQRVFHPIAVHFKGSGFYNTDYGTAKRKRENDATAKSGAEKSEKSGDGGSASSSSSSSDGKGESAKPAAPAKSSDA